jgi:iron(III) transport system permease protein
MNSGKNLLFNKLLQFFYFLILLLPLLVLFFYPTEESNIEKSLFNTALTNTAVIAFCVLIMSTITGLFLATAIHFLEFPFKKLFHIIILLPLAIPAYVLAFIYIGLLGSQSWFYFLNPQGELYFLVLVLSFSLTPYVYYFSLLGLRQVTQNEVETELIFKRGWTVFFKLNVFPKVFPFLLSAQILLIFETLADFGAASVINVPVITTLIYKSWFDLFSFSGAVLISLKYSVLILFILVIEFLIKRKVPTDKALSREKVRSFKIKKHQQMVLFFLFLIYALFSILIPVLQILYWSTKSLEWNFIRDISWSSFWTVLLGLVVGMICVSFSFLLSLFLRLNKENAASWLSVSTIGYSLPGSLLAVSTYAIILYLTKNLSQNVLLCSLIIALTYKFLTVSLRTVSESIDNIPKELDEVSAIFNSSLISRVKNYFYPYAKDSIVIGLILVMMEVMKEMPLTLMLSPSRYQTLSNKIFTLTAEGEWVKASLPSLVLIIVGFLSVYFIHLKDKSS